MMDEYERRTQEIARDHRTREPVLGLGAMEPTLTHTPPAPPPDVVTIERLQPYRVEQVSAGRLLNAWLGADGVLRAHLPRRGPGSTVDPVVVRAAHNEGSEAFGRLLAAARR